MKYMVYSKYIKNGKTDYLIEFETMEDAVRHVAKCYRIDGNTCQLGEYYYYIKERN